MENKIIINTSKKAQILELDNIEYLKSKQCYTEFYTVDNNKILSSKPIKYYETILSERNFIRVHNQYLVNKNHIKEILSGIPLKIVLTSGTSISVTRLKKHDLLREYLI